MKVCLRQECKQEFEPNKPKQVFCSAKCRVYHNRKEKKKLANQTDAFKEGKHLKEVDFFNRNINYHGKNVAAEVYKKQLESKPITDKPIYEYPLEEKDCEPLSESEISNLKQRQVDLRKEIANPGNPLIGKKMYISIRENELKEIQNKLK